MNMNVRTSHLAIVPLLALALGCSSTVGPESEAAKPSPEGAESTTQAGGRAALPAAQQMLEHVYFATDSARLEQKARDRLERSAEAIIAHPEWGTVTVEGHCDERGSDSYNHALGERRARAVSRFLVEQGVPASRLETRSYGSTQPAVVGRDERAWRYNRRSELDLEVARMAPRSADPEDDLAANEGT